MFKMSDISVYLSGLLELDLMEFLLFYSQVMVQPHNRHSTMSLYLATLAVSDTVSLIIGKVDILMLQGLLAKKNSFYVLHSKCNARL